MPKVTLTFNLDNEDDKEKFEAIASEEGPKLKTAMWNFAQEVLRRYRKYGIPSDIGITPEMSKEAALNHLVDHISDAFYQYIDDQGATIE